MDNKNSKANNLMDKNLCDIVEDLLPLYYDGVCSDKSKVLVEEHVKTCPSCKVKLEALKNTKAEKTFRVEAKTVLKQHAKKEKTAAMIIGSSIAGVLMVPIVISLLLSFGGYSDWKTNAVLIASMLLVAGLTVVPILSKTNKFSRAIMASTAALVLIIFFVEMFFYKGGWLEFGEIATSVVFGISIVFFPFVVKQAELPQIIKNHKGLLVFLWDTLWFYLMLFLFAVDYPIYTKDILGVSTFFAGLIWIGFLIIRYLKINPYFRAGLVAFVTGFWFSMGNRQGWVMFMNQDIHKEILFVSLVIAGILGGIGIADYLFKMRRNSQRK